MKVAHVNNKPSTPFQRALETVERLPESDQEALVEVIRARLIEHRRTEIAIHARETLQAFREGRAKYGTLEDLKEDLLS